MKKSKPTLLLLLLLTSAYAKAQYKLEIEIVNLISNKGVVLLELFDEHQKSMLGKQGEIVDKKCIITIDNLTPSRYAVRYIHDENSNDKLDTNWMGIPSEGYGFSNNAYGSFGPKSFNEWLFEVKGDTRIVMKIKN